MGGLALALNLGLAGPKVGGGGGGYVFTNVEAAAVVARMSPAPNDARKAIIDTLIGALKANGTSGTNKWTKLDCLWILAADAAANGLLEWKGSAAYNGVVSGTVSFVADRGFSTSFGSTGNHIATSYAPSVSSLGFAQDSAHLGCYVVTDNSNVVSDAGFGTSANRVAAKTGVSSSVAALNSTSGAVATSPAGTAPHHICGIRSGSTTFASYRNGVAGSNVATASTSVGGGGALVLCAQGTSNPGTDRNLAIAHVGIALTAAECFDFYSAFNVYLTAIGSPA